MKQLITGGMVYCQNGFLHRDVAIVDGKIHSVSVSIPTFGFDNIISAENKYLIPGFADVHVHLREPGFSYKETITTGTRAGAKGGYTALCTMPNLNPVPDSELHLAQQQELIEKTGRIHVYPYASITVGQKGEELTDFEALAKAGALAFSDDGKGIQGEGMMREAMERAKVLGKHIVAHCEDNSLLFGGYIHAGEYAQAHGHRGISSQSEWKQIERDLRLAADTGCRYHVCHISTKESVALIRDAKASGVKVTCETGPHYLTMCDMDLQEDGRFKMNPPIRGAADRDALVQGLVDGTIDCVATDHAPHSAEEKCKGLEKSMMGVVGLETAFGVLNTHLVNKGVLSLEKLVEAMSVRPRAIFGLQGGSIGEGQPADLTLLDTQSRWTVEPDKFVSLGHSTPFAGWELCGEAVMTMVDGNIVWQKQ